MTLDRDMRRRRSAALLQAPFHPGDAEADRIFALFEARESAGEMRLHAPGWAPTIALDASARDAFGLDGPTTATFFEQGTAPGLFSVSSGLYIWMRCPGEAEHRMVLLERDGGAPVYPGHLSEPAGRCGEAPSRTMALEPNQELLIVAIGRDPVDGRLVQRPVVLAMDQVHAMDHGIRAAKAKQVTARAGALAAAGADPAACAEALPLTLLPAPREADMPHLRSILVQAEGRVIERFPAMAWVLRERRCVEVRRSVELDFPGWVEQVVVVDGESFDRRVHLLRGHEVGNIGAPLIPSLTAYRSATTRPSLRVLEGGR